MGPTAGLGEGEGRGAIPGWKTSEGKRLAPTPTPPTFSLILWFLAHGVNVCRRVGEGGFFLHGGGQNGALAI